MAFDSRSRPVRRPARPRVSKSLAKGLTALALLVMAAGLWFSGPAAASVPAPRLQVAEARVAAAEAAGTADSAPAAPAAAHAEREVPAAVVAVAVAPVAQVPAAEPAPVALPVGGPRAPPLN